MDKLLEILRLAKEAPDKTIWKSDPFEFLTENVVNYDEQLASEEICVESSSSSTLNTDCRLKYARMMSSVYCKLAQVLEEKRRSVDDEHQILSLQNVATISNSFQFFVIAAVLPFLDEGVGLPIAQRSSFIKSWKRFDGNVEEQSRMLSMAARTILSLFNSNQLLKVQLLNKFIDDVLCVKLQLNNLGKTQFDQNFVDLFAETPKELLVSALMGLSKPRKNRIGPPAWLQQSCGAELSSILTGAHGLSHFLAYYSDVGGPNWSDNVPMRVAFAKQLARVPKSFKSTSSSYLRCIFEQFVDILDDKNAKIFASFVAEAKSKYPKTSQIVIFDAMFGAWERLALKCQQPAASVEKIKLDRHAKVLLLLAKLESTSILMERFLKLFDVFMELSQYNDAYKPLVRLIMKNVKNSSALTYNYIVGNCTQCRIVEKPKKLIMEIDEEEQEVEENVQVGPPEAADEAVTRRLEHVRTFGMEPLVYMGMLEMGVNDWFEASSDDEADCDGRFVSGEKNVVDSSHAHLIVGVCFEKVLEDMDVMDGVDKYEILLRIVDRIVRKTCGELERIDMRRQSVDVFHLSTIETESIENMMETMKMCIGIVSTMIMAASFEKKIAENLEHTMIGMRRFVEIAKGAQVGEKVEMVASEANELLKLINMEICGKPNETPSTSSTIGEEARSEPSNVCADIIEKLTSDDEPIPIRGAALIQVSRIFRRKNVRMANELIEMDVFEKCRDLVNHDDSYVYLSAINAICEIACFDQNRLEELMDLYADEMGGVVQRGRLGEAIGKVFRHLGATSIRHVARMTNGFVKACRDKEEIVRASAASALADLLVATSGRGMEKHLVEMMHAVDAMVLMDESSIGRRAAVHLVRQCVRSCGTDLLQIMGNELKQIHREMRKLWKTDRDEIVRLHAQLCIEEMNASLVELFEEESSRYCRRINI